MAIDTRYSLLSLLARRREKFTDWLEHARVTSYEALCEKTDTMGARPVPLAEYVNAADELKAKHAAVKKLERAAESDEKHGTHESSKNSPSVLADTRQARKTRASSQSSRGTSEPSDD